MESKTVLLPSFLMIDADIYITNVWKEGVDVAAILTKLSSIPALIVIL